MVQGCRLSGRGQEDEARPRQDEDLPGAQVQRSVHRAQLDPERHRVHRDRGEGGAEHGPGRGADQLEAGAAARREREGDEHEPGDAAGIDHDADSDDVSEDDND